MPRRALVRLRRRRAGPRAPRSFLWRLRRVLFGLFLLAVAAVSGFGFILSRVPLPEIPPPVETTFLLDSSGQKLAELSPPNAENRVVVKLDAIAPVMIDAVLAAEDGDFFSHPGIDISAIVRATIDDLQGKPLRGGSTITQQYIKQELVGTERTLIRKLREATLALKLEQRLSKEEILERYLNTIYFGRNAYGVEAAARSYFSVAAADLDVGQAALLAGLIRAPEAADPSTDPEEAVRRRGVVLTAMLRAGMIDEATKVAADAVPIDQLARPRTDVAADRYVGAEFGTQYIVEHVRRTLPELGFTDAEINGGGLRVHTTIDMRLQAAAYRAVYVETLDRPDDPAAALVSVDTDGMVRAMVGGRSWDEETPWARVNLATGAFGGGTGRQPGSAFKPFALAAAVADGYSLRSEFDAPSRIAIPGADNGKDWNVRNYGGSAYGRVDLWKATASSVNTAYAELIDVVGAGRVADMANRLGVTSEIAPQPSIVLGTPSVSVLDMASAYATFANRGVRVEPTIITLVTDSQGNVLWRHRANEEQVLSEGEADLVTAALQGVIRNGTGTRANIGTAAAGKTGTTQNNGDAWFVGYTPTLSTAVWLGYPQGQDTPMNNVRGGPVTGGGLPAQAWQRYMRVAVEDPKWTGEFVAPRNPDVGHRLVVSLLPVPAEPAGPPPS